MFSSGTDQRSLGTRESPLIERQRSIGALMSMFVLCSTKKPLLRKTSKKPTTMNLELPKFSHLGSHLGLFWPSSYVRGLRKNSPNGCAS